VQNSPETFSAVEVEGDNCLFGYAVKIAVRTKAQTPGLAKADLFAR
jgi:hypothetical protein